MKVGDRVIVLGEVQPGKPHPHAGRIGVITERWVTRPMTTIRLDDDGPNKGNFIFVSNQYVKPVPKGSDESGHDAH